MLNGDGDGVLGCALRNVLQNAHSLRRGPNYYDVRNRRLLSTTGSWLTVVVGAVAIRHIPSPKFM